MSSTMPRPLPKISQFANVAIIAEAPERPPYHHGTDGAPAINICYLNGAVRQVHVPKMTDFDPKPWLEIVDEPYPTTIENGTAMPVWKWLDKQ